MYSKRARAHRLEKKWTFLCLSLTQQVKLFVLFCMQLSTEEIGAPVSPVSPVSVPEMEMPPGAMRMAEGRLSRILFRVKRNL